MQRGLFVVEDDVNDIIDEMILKAFKIVVKGVRFLDVLEEDRRMRAPTVSIMATVVEESIIPPSLPTDLDLISVDESADQNREQNHTVDAGSRVTVDEMTYELMCHPKIQHSSSPPEAAQITQTVEGLQAVQIAEPTSSHFSPTITNSPKVSQAQSLQVNRLSNTLSHRVSLAGPSPVSTSQKLVSERLGLSHDAFLSYLGSFIGRLHLQSQSRPDLALAVKLSAISGGELLAVIDAVCSQAHLVNESLTCARAAVYERISELVSAAREILVSEGSEVDIIMPQDNGRLLIAATSCVKAAGDCVQKTKWVIERIGDFEFEKGDVTLGNLGIDLGIIDMTPEERPSGSRMSEEQDQSVELATSERTVTPAHQDENETTTEPTPVSAASSTLMPPKPGYLSTDKPLPEVPKVASQGEGHPALSHSPASSRPASCTEEAVSSIASSVSSIRPTLPPLPKLETSLMPHTGYISAGPSAVSNGEVVHSERVDSLTASSTSSTGTTMTHLSRDSEASLVSHTSTRATTPDLAQKPSMSELSTNGSSSINEEVEEVESKLLTKTFAHELLFNKEGQITGGTLPALVERLTSHESTPDAMFVSTFYLTFRLFCTPAKLAEALIDRFDYIGGSADMASPVRLRVYNVFKGWMESHWRPDTDMEAVALIQNFAEHTLSCVLPSAGSRLLALAERVKSSDGSLVPRLVSSMTKTNGASQYAPADTTLPSPVITKTQIHAVNTWKQGGSSPSVLDFDPLEIARQLTLKQMNLFCAIMPEELLGSQWMKKCGAGSPNVKAMTALSTDLSNLVADSILQHNEVKKRAAVIKQWIKIAQQCLELHNYDSLMAIICSLNSSTISRLRKTWEFVSPRRREILKTLQAIVEPSNNNKVLRGRLHDHIPPCLPFLGMFLTDLTFVDIGNPPTKQLSHNGSEETGLTVVNFDKHLRTSKIISELQRFQIPYRLSEIPELQDWIQGQVQRMRESDQTNVQVTYYRKSLLLEPREGAARSQLDGQASHGQKDLFGWITW